MERSDGTQGKQLARRWWALAACVCGTAFFANILALRDEPFVPPSQFFFNTSFSVRMALERAAPSDILVLGNSRMRSGFSPAAAADALGQNSPSAPVLRLLADAGGFPAFYDAAFDLARQGGTLPRAVVVGISPRDLDEGDLRKRDPMADLLASSGYRLAHLPYNRVFAALERLFVDAVAAGLPGLYERERVAGALIPDFVSKLVTEDLGASRVGLVLQLWMRRHLGQREGAWPADAEGWHARLDAWAQRAAGFAGAPISPARVHLDALGGPLPDAPETADQQAVRIAKVEAAVVQAKARGAERECRTALAGTTFEAFIDKLVARGVAVYLVQPPALYLEPCEMRAIEEGHFQRAIDRLLQKHGARVRFLDLMSPPGKALRDPRYFADPDHMRAEGADLVGRTVGAWLAPLLR